MKSYVFCKTEMQGLQTFYLNHLGHNYRLFSQAFRISVKEHFRNGYLLDQGYDYGSSHSSAVRRTLDKIKQAIPTVERVWNISVLKRTKRKNEKHNARQAAHRAAVLSAKCGENDD